jgi:transcriptional regulator with AAA-type ATPase domain/tetratricopeptide (TPR) repeat protein
MTVALEALKGRSPRIEAIRKQVAQLLARQTSARHLPAILILGETGTGKGLLARTLHEAGPRRDNPFVDINCAAIPETLLEAELFGYERGAFTDARQAKPGLFQTAHGGTLFLDEIGLLPASLQSKLLTVLEDRSIRRLGSTRAEPVDVMLVAATSLDLRRAVADGRFREDLYHRVAVITLELPPLCTRGMDILTLADHFLARACVDYGLSPRRLAPDALDALMAHRWPGNVRELANAMERVALLSDRDEITAATLDFLTSNDAVDPADAGNVADAGSLERTLRARIEAALRASGGNIRRTAAALGISRNTLRARMDKYGLRHHDVVRPRTLRPVPESLPTVAPSALPPWERRRLSFLRVKLPESPTVDAGRALEMIGEKVRTFGGRVEDTSPTGVIGVFGLEPVDNAPSHAALAALAIQNAAARAHTAGRAGGVVSAIHCADHLVAHHDSLPVIAVDGKAATWSILERMVATEVAGAIVVSSQVVPFLVRRFALERIQHSDLDVWLVLRVEKVAAGWNASRFVGRSSELDALRYAASQAEQRHGQIVGVVGEAGVGKSRLVHEAVQPLKDWLVLSSAGAPFMRDTPFFPVVELLKSLCRIEDMDTPAEMRQRVTRALPRDADCSVLAPILDLLRVLPLDDAFRNVDAGQRRKRTHDAVKQLFLAASVAQPLCLIIEDLHWIDSETQQVLDNLVNSITGARVLLLVNYRPEYQHPWGSKTNYGQVRLDALPIESASELLDMLLGRDVGLAPLKHLLVRRGNPFYLEETVRMLVEANALAGERGRYRLTHPIHAIQVPPTVYAMLAARIDRLPPEDRHLLQVASVIGKDIPLTLLGAVADLPDEALRRGLERLQAAEFVYEAGAFPELEYTFKHALTHDVAYGSLLDDRRRALHAALVGAIERLYADRLDEHLEELAHHARRGDLRDEAVTYLRKAGDRAAARSAHREAIAFFEQTLAVLGELPETLDTLAATVDIRIAHANALLAAKGVASAEVDTPVRHAHALASRLGDRARLFNALWAQWFLDYTRGQYREALEIAGRLLGVAEADENPDRLLQAHHSLWATLGSTGEAARALPHCERGFALYDPSRHASHAFAYGGHDPGACCGTHVARAQWSLGYPERAAAAIRDAVALTKRLAHPLSMILTKSARAFLEYQNGEYDAARETAGRMVALATTHDLTAWGDDGLVILACVQARQHGDYRSLYELGEQLPTHPGPVFRKVINLVLMAELLSEVGDIERGLTILDAITADYRNTILGSEIRRIRGHLLLRRDKRDDSEREFRHAIDLARHRSQRMLELRATMSLARLWQQTGRRSEACQILGEIYGSFTEGLDTTDLRVANALLDELSVPKDL